MAARTVDVENAAALDGNARAGVTSLAAGRLRTTSIVNGFADAMAVVS